MAEPACQLAPPMELAPSSPASFRSVLGCFPTGVAVVTTRLGNRAYGITVNAFSAVSLRPPLILTCISRGSRFLHGLAQTKVFAVSVLSEQQVGIARAFANSSRAQTEAQWFSELRSPLGSPLIEGAVAWLDCKLERVHDGGDHVICLGRVDGLAAFKARRSLVFNKGEFCEVGSWTDPADAATLCWPVT